MNSAAFRFEKLSVWRLARQLNTAIYQTTGSFPAHENFGSTLQLRRAAVSISSNIAEGSGRNSDKDFAHFLEQAYGSLMELASQIYLAADLEYIDEPTAQRLLEQTRALAPKIVALNRSLKVADSKVKLPNPSPLDSRPSSLDSRTSTPARRPSTRS